MPPSPSLCHIQNHVLGILVLGYMASILSAVLVDRVQGPSGKAIKELISRQITQPAVHVLFPWQGAQERVGEDRLVDGSVRQSPSAEQSFSVREG